MNGSERPRPGPLRDNPPPREPRRVGETRNGGGSGPTDSSQSRAEKFEDEKRRIIQSCFSKKDPDNTVVESYITHIRITEDANYPSAPPPPNSSPENKKVRAIIVAVRKSGRVRMHKARENNDGSFSIGKTWMLDDLSVIQSYNGLVPTSPAEQQQKQWASNVGFSVTLGKQYYWHASTAKEKEFFIASLVKIYRKYTGGKVPTLVGFDDRERQLLAGTGPAATPSSTKSPSSGQNPESSPSGPPLLSSFQPARSQSPYSNRVPRREEQRDLSQPSSDEQTLRAQKSRDQMRRPSTGQSAKGPAPPQMPPPSLPSGPRDYPPPRAADRFGDTRSGPGSRANSPEAKRVKDSLRPTTPASTYGENRLASHSPAASLDQRSQLSETSERKMSIDARPQSRDPNYTNAPLHVPTQSASSLPSGPISSASGEVPLSLRPGSSASNRSPSPTPVLVERQESPSTTPSTAVVAEAAAATVSTISTTVDDDNTLSEPAAQTKTLDSSAASPADPIEASDSNEAHRPGLGPMVKKKSALDIAGAFRKAATAYGAFKPRPGGAGERLLAAAKRSQQSSSEPDGITGVVPAPSLRAGNEAPPSMTQSTQDKEATSMMGSTEQEVPAVEVTKPTTESAVEEGPEPAQNALDDGTASKPAAVSSSAQDRRRKRREDNTSKYCEAVGIDINILEGRGVDFDDILTDLGWNGRLNDDKRIEDLEADIRREIGRVEATSWLGNLEQQEGKVDQLAKLIDKTIGECEELDGLLTLYSHELNTLHDDVAHIEAQSQGLQVQTANQKLLQSELQKLLKTLSISSSDLQSLKEASLSNPDGLKDTEETLSVLYQAMVMIDPEIWQNKRRLAGAAGELGSVGVYADTEVGQMRAIKEKKEEYRAQARLFLQRLKQFMAIAFKIAEQKMSDSAAAGDSKDNMKLDFAARDYFRQEIWMYNALMLFAREVSTMEWHGLIGIYEQQAKTSYTTEFREHNAAWIKTAKKPTGEEQELLFTHQDKEKDSEVISMAARKLTVRRAKTVRATQGLRLSLSEKQTGRVEPYEVFAGVLQDTLNMVSGEQNFIVEFFHLNSLSNTDFPDLVSSAPPEERRRPDFSAKLLLDPDRDMAKKVEQVMDEVFSFWPTDIQNLVDWATKSDPLQGVGMLYALEREISNFEETNQEFILHALQKLHSRLLALFNRFVDEQIRAIEEIKVKVNKRKGVISFMRVFPNFMAVIENMLTQTEQEVCDVRVSVNEAYNRINRAMWESLKFIAKEAPGQQAGAAAAAGGDPADKEALNYHILMIENMNHYIEEVDVRGIPVLENWHGRAQQDFEEHMKFYMDSVIRRPLGRLLDFVESTEALLTSSSSSPSSPGDIASRASHSRLVAKKVFASYDAKEIRRGIEQLKKRVEKHFGDADDPGLSRSLVLKVFGQCESRYDDAYDRSKAIIDSVYDGQIDLEWRKEDATAMFKK